MNVNCLNLKKLMLLIIVATMFGTLGCDGTDEPNRENPKPIPTIHIYTEGGLPVDSKEDYRNATFTLDGHGTCDNIGETDLRIRGRGNSTWAQPKKPYRLNFNTAISFFGLPAVRNWVLLANYLDETHLFNSVAFELGQRLNMPWTNNSFFVELYLNDSWQGVYLLTQHLSGNVVLNGDDILMELDVYFDEDHQFYSDIIELPVMLQNPSNVATLERAKDIWDKIESKLYPPIYANTPEVLDSNSGWRDLFNLQSIMDYFLLYEIMGNTEIIAWPKSFFVRYLANDEKIHFGPIWDFDWGWQQYYIDSPDGIDAISYRKSNTPPPERNTPGRRFVSRFFDDPKFVREYKQYSKSVIETLNADKYIDSLGAVLKPYMAKEYEKWEKTYNYNEQIAWFKNFHKRKMNAVKSYINE